MVWALELALELALATLDVDVDVDVDADAIALNGNLEVADAATRLRACIKLALIPFLTFTSIAVDSNNALRSLSCVRQLT